MPSIKTFTEVQRNVDSDGNVSETVKEQTSKIERLQEPEYIKLYTKMWCVFNQVPVRYQPLFICLALRMQYCNAASKEGGQLVNTGMPYREDICKQLGWNNAKDGGESSMMQGLRELCKCGAIKKVNRGVYQINPQYAGKGTWKYDPTREQGGIEDLIAKFSFKDGTVETEIKWGDDGEDTELNNLYRQGLNTKADDKTVLKTRTIKKATGQDDAAKQEQGKATAPKRRKGANKASGVAEQVKDIILPDM